MSSYSYTLEKGAFITSKNPPDNYIELEQTHSTNYVHATNLERRGDAFVVNYEFSKQIPVIKTADCLPILALSLKKYFLIHAGRKGLLDGILQNKILLNESPYLFFVGPSIGPCCYKMPESWFDLKTIRFQEKLRNEYTLNLWKYTKVEIKNFFPQAKIIFSEICTHCDTNFYSYRRNATKKRNFNYFSRKEAKIGE